jgi:hypothetical protein
MTEPLIGEDRNGTQVFELQIFYLNSKRQLNLSWSYFLYLCLLEFAIIIVMIIFNFMGWVTSIDYYWSIFLLLPHLFSWATVVGCLSKNFSFSFYKATMILYGFLFFLDLAAFVWRIISYYLCDPITNTLCATYNVFGLVGWILSLYLMVWDVIVFIGILFLLSGIQEYITKKKERTAEIIKRLESEQQQNAIGETAIAAKECEDKIISYFKELTMKPVSNSTYSRRFILVVAFLMEAIFFFAVLVIILLGFVISDIFVWEIFVQSIHFFSWVFLACCVYNNYSKTFFKFTMVLYLLNWAADGTSFILRAVQLAQCNPYVNVDCCFVIFPGWIPIELLIGLLWVIDTVVIFTLSNFFTFLYVRIWYRASEIEDCLNMKKQQYRDTVKVSIATSSKTVQRIKADKNYNSDEKIQRRSVVSFKNE